ncbi:hypothetical protein T484DRAFT_1844505, partial [Baffinella frigidus]
NASGSTPLHVVVRAGDAKLLSMILAFHPDINAREGSSTSTPARGPAYSP